MGIWCTGEAPRAGDILRIRGALDESTGPYFGNVPYPGGESETPFGECPPPCGFTHHQARGECYLEPKKHMHITRLRTKRVLLPTW
jgi:hypothetical protein